jgi:hypothetical protein
MTGIQIELKLRPCYISIEKGKKEKALFHGWNFVSNVVTYITGIVELEDGRVIEVMPGNITFVKGIFQDYCWDEKGDKVCEK